MTRRDDVLKREETRARTNGLIEPSGTRYGSADGHRSIIEVRSTSRRRCGCGCNGRATHTGIGDGLAMMSGCELKVRRWVRDGYTAALAPEGPET